MKRSLVRTVLTVTALTAATGLGWAGAPPAGAEPGCQYGSNDFNQDGVVDVAVGMPGDVVDGSEGPPGIVEVRVSDGDSTTVHRLRSPEPQDGDLFGTAVAEVAASAGAADRCSMLAVGAPGYDVEIGEGGDVGAVYLFRWDSAAEEFVDAGTFGPGRGGVPAGVNFEEGFGQALAAPYHGGGDGLVTPLYVGAPGYHLDAAPAAGAVYRLTFATEGEPAVDEATFITQDSPGVPDTAESGDGLGASLAAVDGGVLAGAPGESVGTAERAGGFLSWREDGDVPARFVTQDTAGVPGTAEDGDHFGEVIYAAHEVPASGGGHYVMVGAPLEDIGTVQRAGSAIRFVYDGDVGLDKVQGFNQNTAGVAGTPEANDYFGSSFGSYGPTRVLVGVPFEDIGTVRDAGMVQGLSGDRSWHQGTAGVPGSNESYDHFGATIGNALYGMGGQGEDGWLGDVLVGVPHEDGYGAVVAGLPGGSATPTRWSPGPSDSNDYGIAIGKTN